TLLRLQPVPGGEPGRAVLPVHRHRRLAHQRGGAALHGAAGARRAERHRVQRPVRAAGLRCEGGLPALQTEVRVRRVRVLGVGPPGRGGSEEQGLPFRRPDYPAETTEEESVVEDDAELTLSKVEEETIEEPDDEEENVMDLEALKLRTCPTDTEASSKPEEILEATVDAAEWSLEVERVLPQLKVTVRTDNKDWRIHVEQMHQHRDGIKSSLKEATSYLDRLQEDVGKTLEKVSSREKYINNQLESLIQEYRGAQARLSQAKERYQQASGGVTERTRVLAEISEELEKVKQEMEEKGSSMSDG
ncbi:hypothetical protein KUCAC02_025014, partial [Chaenocephalus aceratus]